MTNAIILEEDANTQISNAAANGSEMAMILNALIGNVIAQLQIYLNMDEQGVRIVLLVIAAILLGQVPWSKVLKNVVKSVWLIAKASIALIWTSAKSIVLSVIFSIRYIFGSLLCHALPSFRFYALIAMLHCVDCLQVDSCFSLRSWRSQ